MSVRDFHELACPSCGSDDNLIVSIQQWVLLTGGSVAMLLNLASLCHRTRTAWWKRNPPARLYAIDDVVCWPVARYGPAPEAFKRHRYVWAVWTPGHEGPSQFWWLSAREFRDVATPRPAISQTLAWLHGRRSHA